MGFSLIAMVIEICLIVLVVIQQNQLKAHTFKESEWNRDVGFYKDMAIPYLSNKDEEMLSLLARNNLKNKRGGFCILTNRAYYFVGEIWQKKSILSVKSSVQHRVNVEELKGIKIGRLRPWASVILLMSGIVFTICQIISFCRNILQSLTGNQESDLLNVILFIAICLSVASICVGAPTAFSIGVIDLEFNGLTISFLVGECGKQEIDDFKKAVSDINERRQSVPIYNSPVSPTVQSSSTVVQRNFCPNCGAPLEATAKFCVQCGKPRQ